MGNPPPPTYFYLQKLLTKPIRDYIISQNGCLNKKKEVFSMREGELEKLPRI
jgi:hypothetical protein